MDLDAERVLETELDGDLIGHDEPELSREIGAAADPTLDAGGSTKASRCSMEFHPVADIFPLLQGQPFEDLVADIKEHGQREPIWIHKDGRIIDGRNRARACERLGIVPGTHSYMGPDDGLVDFVVSLNLHRRHLNESQRAMVAARLVNTPAHRPGSSQICEHTSQGAAAGRFRVSKRTVETAAKVLQNGSPRLVKMVDSGEVAVSDAATVIDLPASQQDALAAQVESGEATKLKNALKRSDVKAKRIGV